MLASREVISIDLPVPFDTAWVHLRRPELIRRWYGWDEPDLDEEIERVFLREAVVHRPESGMAMGWLRWHNRDTIEVRGAWTTKPRTTLVVRRLDHDLLASYDGVRDDADERWITWVQQLRFALAHHLGEDRTAFAMHGLDGDRPDRLLYRAGLHGARGVPLGGAVEIHRPDGSLLGGTLEYSTRSGTVKRTRVEDPAPPLSRCSLVAAAAAAAAEPNISCRSWAASAIAAAAAIGVAAAAASGPGDDAGMTNLAASTASAKNGNAYCQRASSSTNSLGWPVLLRSLSAS